MDKVYQVEIAGHQLRRLEDSKVEIESELDPRVPDLLEDILAELKEVNKNLNMIKVRT